jgi:hypothetical protein
VSPYLRGDPVETKRLIVFEIVNYYFIADIMRENLILASQWAKVA